MYVRHVIDFLALHGKPRSSLPHDRSAMIACQTAATCQNTLLCCHFLQCHHGIVASTCGLSQHSLALEAYVDHQSPLTQVSTNPLQLSVLRIASSRSVWLAQVLSDTLDVASLMVTLFPQWLLSFSRFFESNTQSRHCKCAACAYILLLLQCHLQCATDTVTAAGLKMDTTAKAALLASKLSNIVYVSITA